MSENKSVCVVVPVHNRVDSTLSFIKNFNENANYPNYKIVIVDDGSTDGTGERIKENFKDVILLRGNGNLWWTGGTNLGVKYALENSFDFVLTINNDAKVERDYLKNLIDASQSHPNSLIANPILLNDTFLIWTAGVKMHWKSFYLFERQWEGVDIHDKRIPGQIFEVETMPGDGVLIPIEVFRKVGLYRGFFFPQYHADTDFALNARKKGFRSYVTMKALLHNPAISGQRLVKTKWDYVFNKKSDSYLWAVFWFYMFHAPLKYKLCFWMKLYPEFQDTKPILFLRKIRRSFKHN